MKNDMETSINLLEKSKDLLKCKNCIFDDGCERMFSECVSNFTNDEFGNDTYHLKYCDKTDWDTLNEITKKNFIRKVVAINERFRDVNCDIK